MSLDKLGSQLIGCNFNLHVFEKKGSNCYEIVVC